MKSSILTRFPSVLFQKAAANPGPTLRARKFTYAAVLTSFIIPSLAHAASVDLRTATEGSNSILMYISGSFAAIGIVTAGVAMMTGRSSVAKWAFVGAMVCGLAFPIVRAIWSTSGLEAADVGTFAR